jgi:hypothetical protein
MTSTPPPGLSDNQRRTISTTLSMLDEMLCEFEERSGKAAHDSILFRRVNSLTPAARRVIHTEAAQMRSLLAVLRDDLRLTCAVRDVAISIGSKATVFWESLCELEARRLQAYGTVPDGLAEYLDPKVRELNDRLTRIARIVTTDAPMPADPEEGARD